MLMIGGIKIILIAGKMTFNNKNYDIFYNNVFTFYENKKEICKI